LAQEARQLGAETLTELENQAEAIDRIEYNVDNINHNLDEAERALRGIESITGALANAMSDPKHSAPVYNAKDRSIQVKERQQPDVDYEVLFKHPSDQFSSCSLRFSHANGAVWIRKQSNRSARLFRMQTWSGLCFERVRSTSTFASRAKMPRIRTIESVCTHRTCS